MIGAPSQAGWLDFSGKTVLVVGGSSGIGNAVAQGFRAAGAEVHVWGTRDRVEDYPDGGASLQGLTYSRVDVSAEGEIERFVAPFDRLDVLVLSQGTVRYKRMEFEAPTFREVMEVNLVSVLRCAMKFKDMLARAGGSLILLNSVASFRATKGNPAYSASKHGTLGLTKTLAQSWAAEGVRVNGIAPGFIRTGLTSATVDDPERLRRAEQAIPLGRVGDPAEIASIALFLASPMASFIVGHTILADGGMTL